MEDALKLCAVCRGPLEPALVEDTIKVDGHTFAAQLPAQRCTKCSETYLTADAVGQFELAVALRLADAGAGSGDGFRFMRKALGLKSVELAGLLDVAAETMSRWESGKLTVPRSSAALLTAMVHDTVDGKTTTRDQLSRLQKPARLGNTVNVTITQAA